MIEAIGAQYARKKALRGADCSTEK